MLRSDLLLVTLTFTLLAAEYQAVHATGRRHSIDRHARKGKLTRPCYDKSMWFDHRRLLEKNLSLQQST